MSDMKESGERLIRVDGVRKDLFLAVLAYLYGEDRQKVLKHVISVCLRHKKVTYSEGGTCFPVLA